MSEVALKKKSLTIETSFYGYKAGTAKHFEVKDLHRIGSSIVEAIYAESSKDPKMFNWNTIKQEMKEFIDLMKNQRKSKRSKSKDSSQLSSDDQGSDSDPEADQMDDKERAQLFLDPVIANKIGMNEIKVIDRSQRKLKKQDEAKQEEDQLRKYERIVDGFNEKLDDFVHSKQQSANFMEDSSDAQYKLKKAKNFQIRETKSVTKILPFKFTQRPSKQKSPLIKKVRKSVELTTHPQKLSIPQVRASPNKKNNFWSSLKKQYEVLVEEKKRSGLLRNANIQDNIESYRSTALPFRSIQHL